MGEAFQSLKGLVELGCINMADVTAAFFAKKKGKKKTFKSFNANKVDASTLATSIYIEDTVKETKDIVEQQTENGNTGKSAGELLDMKALEEQRKAEDDLEAKIRLEETRAQLAAAKLNMEAEGKRIEEERKEAERRKKRKGG